MFSLTTTGLHDLVRRIQKAIKPTIVHREDAMPRLKNSFPTFPINLVISTEVREASSALIIKLEAESHSEVIRRSFRQAQALLPSLDRASQYCLRKDKKTIPVQSLFRDVGDAKSTLRTTLPIPMKQTAKDMFSKLEASSISQVLRKCVIGVHSMHAYMEEGYKLIDVTNPSIHEVRLIG